MKILYLYPKLMNLYGEYGNIVVLKKHIEDQGYEVIVDECDDASEVNFEKYDFVYCGSGLESNQMIALYDLLKNLQSFKKAVDKGVLMLFTGNAMELLGEYVNEDRAMNIVNINSIFTNKRYSGDVIVKNELFGEVVGFINKCSLINNENNKLFEYVFKDAGLADGGKNEGYRINNAFGTHIIGPILVKNPKMMKYFVTELCKKVDKKYEFKDISYPYEEDSYDVTLNALKRRKK